MERQRQLTDIQLTPPTLQQQERHPPKTTQYLNSLTDMKKAALFLMLSTLIGLMAYSFVYADTAGYTSIGANDASIATLTLNNPVGLKVTLPTDGTVTKVSVAVKYALFTSNVVARIYSDNAGERGTLLFTSDAGAIAGTSYAFLDLTFPSTVELSAGTYWIQIVDTGSVSGTRSVAYDTGGASNSGYQLDDLGVPAYNTNQYSIFATYTPDVTPAATGQIRTAAVQVRSGSVFVR